MLVDPSSGAMKTIVTKYNLEGFKGCNDLTFASNGDLYFTDQGQTGHQDASSVFCCDTQAMALSFMSSMKR
jgi:gluconolactonase